jgi:glycosyltransferase involved in cell wall biosynthesis
MQDKVALCFLVWNERQGCEVDLPLVDRCIFDEVFAIDGGSTDGTADVFAKYGIPVHRQTRRGLNAAYWQAVETSTSDHIVVFFPKGTIVPSVLRGFRQLLTRGEKFIVASRVIPGGRCEEHDQWLKPRKWGVCCLAMVSSLLWRRQGPMIWDVLHGVKGFSKAAFLAMNPSRTGLTIDLEMVIRSYKLGITPLEVPVIECPRSYGTTRFKILPTGIKLAKCLFTEIRRSLARRSSLPALPLEPSSVELPDSGGGDVGV